MNNRHNQIKKALLLIATYFTAILAAKANSDNDNMLYPYNDTSISMIDPYTDYSNGSVYISDEETIKSIIVDSNDVFIIDYRTRNDPNMCICNSYKITSEEQMNEIIDILLEYEMENPSDWERTRESLYNEWVLHNFAYQLGIEQTHTQNADLNNNDEERFNSLILRRILK